MCVGDAHSKTSGDFPDEHPAFTHSFGFSYLRGGESSLSVAPDSCLTPRSAPTVIVGMLNILGLGNKLKISGIIVLLVEIDMIDLLAMRDAAIEVCPHHPMRSHPSQPPADLKLHSQVSLPAYTLSSAFRDRNAAPVNNRTASPYPSVAINCQGSVLN